MLSKDEIKEILKRYQAELRRDYHVRRIGIFGSYSRDEQGIESDIDILVELEKPLGLRFVRLARRLEEILGHKVDLVTPNAINPRLWKYIEQDIVYV